jgi:hypothetical protein
MEADAARLRVVYAVNLYSDAGVTESGGERRHADWQEQCAPSDIAVRRTRHTELVFSGRTEDGIT